MTNTDSTRSAYLKAKNIQDCWIFALYIASFIHDSKIKLEWFNDPLKVNFRDGLSGFTVTPPKNIDIVIGTSKNMYQTALGTCFIAFDESLHDLFGDRPTNPDNDINSLRIIVYMMRCSFAHNPAEPKWEIHETFQKMVKIQEIDFTIDFSQLDGIPVKYEHHGGSKGLMDLMSYCLKVIKTKEGYQESA
jgi:hypothetical protein